MRGAAHGIAKREDRSQSNEETIVSSVLVRIIPQIVLSRDFAHFSLEEMSALTADSKEGEQSTNGNDEDVVMQDSSDLSDLPGSDSENGPPRANRRTAARERELARAKMASMKQAQAEHRRLDEEVNKLERKLESIERDFRKLLGAIRVKPLGRDRFYNRVWWFDGMGAASLVGSGGDSAVRRWADLLARSERIRSRGVG